MKSFATAAMIAANAFAITYPGDNCCNLYQEPNYADASPLNICWTSTVNTDFIALGTMGFSNNISSFECGAYVSLDLCKDDGNCETSAGHVMSPQVGYNDQITSAAIRNYDPATQAAIVAFEDKDCK